MIRISELKLPLSALPVEVPRAADAASETEEDRLPTPHPEAALRQLAAQALGVAVGQVNVKAKTAEKLGPVGQGQSMEARAVALLTCPV